MREDCYFYYWICDFGHFYKVRKNSLPHGGISKRFFLDHFSPSFLGQKLFFRYRFHLEGKNDVWISQVRRVNASPVSIHTPIWCYELEVLYQNKKKGYQIIPLYARIKKIASDLCLIKLFAWNSIKLRLFKNRELHLSNLLENSNYGILPRLSWVGAPPKELFFSYIRP